MWWRYILVLLMLSYRCIYSIYGSFLIFLNGSNRFRITIWHWFWLYIFISPSISIIYFWIRMVIFNFISFIFVTFIRMLSRGFSSFLNLFLNLRICIFILRFSFLGIFIVYYFIFKLIIISLWLLCLIFLIYLSIWIYSSLINICPCNARGSSSWLIRISKIIVSIITLIVFTNKL
jgi:hypothetical protein